MINTHSPKGVLFDLDGTLLDHFECLYQCIRYITEKLHKPVPNYEQVKRAIGGGLPLTFAYFVGEENIEQAHELYKIKYAEVAIPTAQLIDGTIWILESLTRKQLKLGLLTNKPTDAAKIICEHTGLTQYFEHIYGAGDTPYYKPDARFTQYALDRMQLSPQECVYIGDTHFDILTAHSVHMPCLIVTTGAQSRETLLAHSPQPAAIYSNLWELGESFFGLESANTHNSSIAK